MKSRVFTDIAGATVVAMARVKLAVSATEQNSGAVIFSIIRDQDETDLHWSIPFDTFEDARNALQFLEQPLLEQIVANAIEFSDPCPFCLCPF